MKKILKGLNFKITNICMLIFAMVSSVNVSFASRINKLYASKLQPVADMVNTYASYFAMFITVLALFAFVYNIIRIGTASGNTAKREQAIRGLMISGVVAALVPFSSTIMFIFLNFQKP